MNFGILQLTIYEIENAVFSDHNCTPISIFDQWIRRLSAIVFCTRYCYLQHLGIFYMDSEIDGGKWVSFR